MDGLAPDGLVVRGQVGRLHGGPGRLRYEARLTALAEGGTMTRRRGRARRRGADAVTLLVAAATNFVNYKDVGGDPAARVEARPRPRPVKTFEALLRGPYPGAPAALPAGRDARCRARRVRPADRRAAQGFRRDERPGARRLLSSSSAAICSSPRRGREPSRPTSRASGTTR